jgi:uncharacterized RDD family membrane protein YckC
MSFKIICHGIKFIIYLILNELNAMLTDTMNFENQPIKYASLTRRILANIIDTILSLLLGFLILLIFLLPVVLYIKVIEPASGPIFDHDTISAFFITIGVFVGFIALISYFVVLQASRHRATYGMRLLSIQIVDENFGTITKKTALGRIILRNALSLIPFLYNIISFFMIMLRKKKQAPHDIMIETYIIRKPFASNRQEQIPETAR